MGLKLGWVVVLFVVLLISQSLKSGTQAGKEQVSEN
jgi:hypothetical protein